MLVGSVSRVDISNVSEQQDLKNIFYYIRIKEYIYYLSSHMSFLKELYYII